MRTEGRRGTAQIVYYEFNRRCGMLPGKEDRPVSEEERVQLTVKLLSEGDVEGVPLVLIEGNGQSLKFLVEFIVSVIEDEDCGRGIGPDGPGSDAFSTESAFGLYIHRLPCMNEQLKRGRRSSAEPDSFSKICGPGSDE